MYKYKILKISQVIDSEKEFISKNSEKKLFNLATKKLKDYIKKNITNKQILFICGPGKNGLDGIKTQKLLNPGESSVFLINKEILSAFLVVFSGAMMISRIPTPSLKNIKLNSLYFRIVVIFVVLILIFLITYFWQTTLAIAIAYLSLAIFNLFFYFFRFFSPISR